MAAKLVSDKNNKTEYVVVTLKSVSIQPTILIIKLKNTVTLKKGIYFSSYRNEKDFYVKQKKYFWHFCDDIRMSCWTNEWMSDKHHSKGEPIYGVFWVKRTTRRPRPFVKKVFEKWTRKLFGDG